MEINVLKKIAVCKMHKSLVFYRKLYFFVQKQILFLQQYSPCFPHLKMMKTWGKPSFTPSYPHYPHKLG